MLPRSAFAPRKKNSGRPAWKVARSYAQWLRGRPCAVAKLGGCAGDMEAAHTPDTMSKAMGSKAADYNEIPLCNHPHDIQTSKGWSAIGLNRKGAHKKYPETRRARPG